MQNKLVALESNQRFYDAFNKNDLDFEEGLDHKVGHLGDTSIEEVKKN